MSKAAFLEGISLIHFLLSGFGAQIPNLRNREFLNRRTTAWRDSILAFWFVMLMLPCDKVLTRTLRLSQLGDVDFREKP